MLELTHSAWEVLDAKLDDSAPEVYALLKRVGETDAKLEFELEAAMNDRLNVAVRQAFRIGFDAARNPEPYIFEVPHWMGEEV